MSDKTSSHSASSASPESRYWFARHSKSIIFLILTLAVVGVYEALSLPIAVFPATNFPRIIVGVDNGVMPIEQMEVTITRPLENAVNSVPGLEDVRSVTSRGSAEIDLSFNWDVNMITTLQLVNSEIARIQSTLPSTAQIESHRLDFASFPILGYSLTSEKVPQTQLWEIATYDMKPRLNRLNGVATVLVQGGQQPEFQVTPDPSKMLRAHVTVQDILDAANHTNLVDSQVHNADDIGNMVIKNVGDAPVRVHDVGVVTASAAPNYTVVTANGKPAVLISISRQPESNTVEVANLVHQEIEALRPKLPAGVDLNVFYDQSNIVRESIASVRDVGTALMTGLVIPVAIFVTFIAMKILGQSFNMMTLGGLAAAGGLVIDDAIVVVENIVLHRDGGEGRLEAVNSALKELTVPLIGSTLTPIVVFLPLISITGVTGTFFRALAIAMSVSLLTSLALALTWSTNLGVYLIRRGHGEEPGTAAAEHAPPEDSENAEFERMRRMMAAEEASLKGGWFEHIIAFYERWLRRALEHPVWLGSFCVILIAVSYVCYSQLGTDLLPHMDEGGFILDYVMPPGSSLQETNRVVTHVENIIKSVPEVENTSRRTGLQLGLAAVTEPNTGDIAVKLKDKRSRAIDDIIADVRAKVTTEEPALDVEFTQVLQDMISDLTGAPQPIVVQLFSPDVDQLTAWAPRVADALGRIQINYKKPVVDVEDGIDNTTSGPAVMFNVNPAAAAKAGFTTDQLTVVASSIVDGEPSTAPVIINEKPYTLRVRYPSTSRASLEAMNSTVIVNANGGAATLGSIATFTEVPGQTEILRDNLQQEKEVTGRLEGLDLGRGIAAVQKAVNDLHLPPSIRVQYGGTYKEERKSARDLYIVLVLAVVLIFVVLLFEFRSFSAPIAILSSAILSTSGVFFALLITNTTFNISSRMGLIMVVGIVAKNGILLLDANQRFRHFGFSAEEAMIQAGRRRLRPIVMTAMAAVAGMLPLSLAIGAGSQMLQPLAIAVIGGILISMVLSLIITPAIQFYMTRES